MTEYFKDSFKKMAGVKDYFTLENYKAVKEDDPEFF